MFVISYLICLSPVRLATLMLVWPGLKAVILAFGKPPSRRMSPMRSRSLWRPHSFGEMEFDIAEVSLRGHGQMRLAEEPAHGLDLFRRGGMLHDHDGVVHVAALDQAAGGQELQLVHEHEGAAGRDLSDIVRAFRPASLLDPEHVGVEIDLHVE